MSRDYSIDLDVMKQILYCKGVKKLDWRISASGRGLHIIWTCSKRTCKRCSLLERQFDDPKRYNHDQRRPRHHRRILWGIKGGRKAGPWKTILKEQKIA
jgi:hypothetical protein